MNSLNSNKAIKIKLNLSILLITSPGLSVSSKYIDHLQSVDSI
jgi:hypothetical protein